MKITRQHIMAVVNSRRNFIVFFSNCQPSGHPTIHTLTDIIGYSLVEDYEWSHALLERMDDLLDLSINESMVFYPNRDDKDIRKEVAIIKRIR